MSIDLSPCTNWLSFWPTLCFHLGCSGLLIIALADLVEVE